LTLGEAKHITHTESKTLNPEWNEQCELPVSGVQSLLLDVCCWDKDRFGKDYLGEFDLALEEIFADGNTEQPPKWYPLKSKRPGKKTSIVSGEVLLQFTLLDSTNPQATNDQIFEKFTALVKSAPGADASRDPTPSRTPILTPVGKGKTPSPSPPIGERRTDDNDEEDEYDVDEDETPEDEDPTKPEAAEKRRRKLRIKGLKRKKRENPYEFINGGSDVVGIIFLEIGNIIDLPPESNLTKTSFDMDPFVVASLGKKTYRTKTIRHNLNPVFNEKMIFQVLGHEQTYSFSFTVIDRDKYSGNDFIASVNFPVKELIEKAPKADPETGLYNLKDVPDYSAPVQRPRFMRLGLSRTSSTQSLSKLSRPPLSKNPSSASTPSAVPTPAATPGPSQLQADGIPEDAQPAVPSTAFLHPGDNAVAAAASTLGETTPPDNEDSDFISYTLPLKMKNLEKWEDKHNPRLFIRAKYMPYPALRQQFWRAMLKQYDTDESGLISKVELTTMLDTLGSTLRESTIDSFFQRFPHKASDSDDAEDLTMDEAVICLEDQLQAKSRPQGVAERVKNMLPDADKVKNLLVPGKGTASGTETPAESETPFESQATESSTISVPELSTPGEEGDFLGKDDLNISTAEEHVVEIRECPICHQPRLNKRKDTDIITHIATCASQDWRQVNNLMMGGFVTSSQAQRKWYSKVITKISYGGYKLGANSANILVQDRITGQINEEKMSVYVRLGIRLLYKGLKSNNMEKKRSKCITTPHPQNN
jgi:phosphatidylserine decarboxylase